MDPIVLGEHNRIPKKVPKSSDLGAMIVLSSCIANTQKISHFLQKLFPQRSMEISLAPEEPHHTHMWYFLKLLTQIWRHAV